MLATQSAGDIAGKQVLISRRTMLSWQAILVALLVTAICLSIPFNGLTTGQIALLIVLTGLVTVVRKGNDAAARKYSIALRSDVEAPPYSDAHVLLLWSTLPLFVLSAYYPLVSAALVAGLLLVFVYPTMKLISASKVAKRTRKNAIKRMTEEPFDVLFYISGPDNSGYQINQWIPVAERLNLRCAICVRRIQLLGEIDETTMPVYFAKAAEDIEVIKDTSGACVFLYPANPRENATSLRHTDIQHYFINHGESDKVVNQSKLLMAYDKLLLAGPMAKDRLEAAGLPVREGQVAYVGRPQIEIFLDKVEQSGPIARVLYAPTWEGFVKEADYSSVSEFGLKMLERILSIPGIEVIFKPHPFTGSRMNSTKTALEEIRAMADRYSNLTVLGHEQKIYPLMNWCDLMIADIGSVVNDFLATGKPVIVTSVKDVPLEALRREFPTTRGTYVVDDPEQIGELLKTVSDGDPMAGTRSDVRKRSLGDFPEGSLARFESMIRTGIKTQKMIDSRIAGSET